MSFETLFIVLKALVPEKYSVNLERNAWRYSSTHQTEKLKVWISTASGGSGKSYEGDAVELVEKVIEHVKNPPAELQEAA